MLSLKFYDAENALTDVDGYFLSVFKPVWMRGELALYVAMALDRLDVPPIVTQSGGLVDSDTNGEYDYDVLEPEDFSNEFMCMLLMIYDNKHEYNIYWCDEKCATILLRLAEDRDIAAAFSDYCNSDFPEPFRIRVMPYNKIVTTNKELRDLERIAQRDRLCGRFPAVLNRFDHEKPLSEAELFDAFLTKYPQTIVTGDSVTAKQAAQIIWSVCYDYGLDVKSHITEEFLNRFGKHLPEELYNQALFEIGIIEAGYPGATIDVNGTGNYDGWCHPDGAIYYFNNVGKNPTVRELYDEWVLIAKMFPFLSVNVTFMWGESWVLESVPSVSFEIRAGKVNLIDPNFKNVHENYMNRIDWMARREYFGSGVFSDESLPIGFLDESIAHTRKLIERFTKYEEYGKLARDLPLCGM